jgi:hypothetical protein
MFSYLGALEKELESNLNISTRDYLNLNTLYFLPNIITPLIAGILTEKLGGVNYCFFYSVCIASIGHISFACKIILIISLNVINWLLLFY